MKNFKFLFLVLFMAFGYMISLPQSSQAKGAAMFNCATTPTGFKMSQQGVYNTIYEPVFFTTRPVCNAVSYHWTLSGNGQTYITNTNLFPSGIVTSADLGCGTSTVTLKVYLSSGTFTSSVTQNVHVICL